MSSRRIRFLPLIEQSGPWQMAADEAMLATAASHGVATLRFYRWSEPTLSLGYFQPHARRMEFPLLRSLPLLRRATGGATLVHDQEITYALALPATPAWQPLGPRWIKQVHQIIAASLADLGIQTQLVGDHAEQKLGPFLCFLHQTPGDILYGSSKVVGSARRKQRGALLQHGGILLAKSKFTPELPGIFDLAVQQFDSETIIESIVRRCAREMTSNLEPDDWTDEERVHTAKMMTERYANPAWNEKR